MATSNASYRKKRSLWNWAPMRAFAKIRQQQFYCVFSIFVQTIDGLPPYMDGLRLVVQIERKLKRWQTLPSRVFQQAAEFDETLHIETTIFGRQASVQDPRLNFLPKDYVLSVVAIDAEEHFLFNRHGIDLSRLLPSFTEGFWEPEKPMSSTASFKLGGKAEGAVLVATFDFEVLNEEFRQDSRFLNGNASARFAESSLKRISRVAKSLPNSPNPSPFVRRANHLFTSPCSSDANSIESACSGKFNLDSSAKETEERSPYDYCSSDEDRFQALKNDPLSLDASVETEVAMAPAVRDKRVLGSLDDFSWQVHLANVEAVEKIDTNVFQRLETDTNVFQKLETDTFCPPSDVQKLLEETVVETNESKLSYGNNDNDKCKLETWKNDYHETDVTADKFCINIKFAKSSPTSKVSLSRTSDEVKAASLEGQLCTGDTEFPYSCVTSRSLVSDGDVSSPKQAESFLEVSDKYLCVDRAQSFTIERIECTPNHCANEREVCMDVQAHLDKVPVALSCQDGGQEGLEVPFSHTGKQSFSVSPPKKESKACLDVLVKEDGKRAPPQSWDNTGHGRSLDICLEASADELALSFQNETGAWMGFQPQIRSNLQADHVLNSVAHKTGLEVSLNISPDKSELLASSVCSNTGPSFLPPAWVDDGASVDQCLENEEHEYNLERSSLEELHISAQSQRTEVKVCQIPQEEGDSAVTVPHMQEDERCDSCFRTISNTVAEELPTSMTRIDIDGRMNAQAYLEGGVQTGIFWQKDNDPSNILKIATERVGFSALPSSIAITDCGQSSAEEDTSPGASIVVEDFFKFLEMETESTCQGLDSPGVVSSEIDDKQMAFADGCQPSGAAGNHIFVSESLKQCDLIPCSQTLQESEFTCRQPVKPFSNLYELDRSCGDDLGLFPFIKAVELEMRKATQSLQSRERAKALEDAETQALMKEWGLTDKVFENSSQISRPFAANEMSNLWMVMLKDGGYLKAVGAYGFCSSLTTQVSKPVVLPTSDHLRVIDVLRCMALGGLENMTTWALMKMPLQDLDCLSGGHVFRDVEQINCNLSSWHGPSKGFNVDESHVVSRATNSKGYKPFEMQHFSEKPVAFKDLIHVALHRIEPLSIEGLKLQCKQLMEAPGRTDSNSSVLQIDVKKQAAKDCSKEKFLGNDEKQVNNSDTASLLDMAISLEEWLHMFQHVAMVEGELSVTCQESQREGSGNVNGIQGRATWADYNNGFILIMRLQLRDPQRYYELVGASMLALVEVRRSKKSYVQLPKREQSTLSSGSYRSMDSSPESHCGTQFEVAGIHIAGVQQCEEGGISKFWGTRRQLQSGSRWLAANFKGIHGRHGSSLVSNIFGAASKRVYSNLLWSISSCPCNPGKTWRDLEDKICPYIRNPDIICGK